MPKRIDQQRATDVSRRNILLAGTTMAAASALAASAPVQTAQAQQQRPAAILSGQRPNILVIFGDDIGQTNISAYSFGLMGYKTPNIDRVAREGMMFTDYYAEQSCTAGRSSFITGQCTLRTGLSKVGIPGATVGLQARDVTLAELLKPLGYATGQFGKNHLGDRNAFLPTVHGFDEFYGNLYHLNAEESGVAHLSARPQVPGGPWSARCAALQGLRSRRPNRSSALGQGRQADNRRYRAAHEEAHGDDRRRDLGRCH
jgi:arylsulfatase A-like enzyme